MNFDKLSKYLDTLAKADVKHFTCCVAKDHEIIYQKAVGFNDYEEKIPATFDAMYLLYSVTKVITCTAAMRLVSEGKLGIDDPVYKYLPKYEHLTVKTDKGIVPAKTVMTVRHLFGMTSGYGGRVDPALLSVVNRIKEEDPNAGTVKILSEFPSVPLEFEPGTHYLYGMSHDILAAVVEVASGMRFGEYLNKIIFEPFGMTDFTFTPDEEKIKRLCAMYSYNTKMNFSTPAECPTSYGYTPTYEAGGAGLYGSALQYLTLADTLACGGISKDGYRLLPEEYVMMMRENILEYQALSDFRSSPRKFGYGWGLCGRAHMSPEISLCASPKGEFGWDSAAAAHVFMDTDNRLSGFFAMHTMKCSYAYEKIHPNVKNLIYEGLGI